jgi:hypothetical protein
MAVKSDGEFIPAEKVLRFLCYDVGVVRPAESAKRRRGLKLGGKSGMPLGAQIGQERIVANFILDKRSLVRVTQLFKSQTEKSAASEIRNNEIRGRQENEG